MTDFNYSLIDNVEICGVDWGGYPDFCDSYIVSADYNGVEMTEEQLDELNDSDYRYDLVMARLF